MAPELAEELLARMMRGNVGECAEGKGLDWLRGIERGLVDGTEGTSSSLWTDTLEDEWLFGLPAILSIDTK